MTTSALFSQTNETAVTPVEMPCLSERNISLWLLRLDQTHPQISGNKWFKLKYNLEAAKEQGYNKVLSFGGAYSNHIHALAWAANALGMQSVGVIRGEPEYAANPTLSDARRWGMQLHFVNRSDYRKRSEPAYIQQLLAELGETEETLFLIPEGGSNAAAVRGCQEIIGPALITALRPDQLILPCGTGGTLAGVALSQPQLSVLGIPVLKNAEFLYNDIRNLISSAGQLDPQNWTLDLEGHCGGYGRTSEQLLDFIATMAAQQAIELDQVYTGKMLLRILQRIEQGLVPEGSTLLAIHTGGLQGLRSL